MPAAQSKTDTFCEEQLGILFGNIFIFPSSLVGAHRPPPDGDGDSVVLTNGGIDHDHDHERGSTTGSTSSVRMTGLGLSAQGQGDTSVGTQPQWGGSTPQTQAPGTWR